MDLQDLQDGRRSDLQFGEITDRFWQSDTQIQTTHTTQVNLSMN